MKMFASLLCALIASSAVAHEGHGAPPLHWHASDTFGFVLVLALAAAALWIGRGR